MSNLIPDTTIRSSNNRPIQIYLGGSFDPVHNSHLALVTHVYSKLDTGEQPIYAYFMPTSRSPLKTDSSDAEQRLNMLTAALAELKDSQGYCNIAISEHEIWQTPPTYSINTLAELRQQSAEASLIFIIGADNIASLPQWHQGDKLTRYAHLWVIPRDELQTRAEIEALLPESLKTQVTVNIEDLKKTPHGLIYIDSHTVPPLSSSAIRTSIAENELDRAKSALPHSVYSYIMKNNLYRYD